MTDYQRPLCVLLMIMIGRSSASYQTSQIQLTNKINTDSGPLYCEAMPTAFAIDENDGSNLFAVGGSSTLNTRSKNYCLDKKIAYLQIGQLSSNFKSKSVQYTRYFVEYLRPYNSVTQTHDSKILRLGSVKELRFDHVSWDSHAARFLAAILEVLDENDVSQNSNLLVYLKKNDSGTGWHLSRSFQIPYVVPYGGILELLYSLQSCTPCANGSTIKAMGLYWKSAPDKFGIGALTAENNGAYVFRTRSIASASTIQAREMTAIYAHREPSNEFLLAASSYHHCPTEANAPCDYPIIFKLDPELNIDESLKFQQGSIVNSWDQDAIFLINKFSYYKPNYNYVVGIAAPRNELHIPTKKNQFLMIFIDIPSLQGTIPVIHSVVVKFGTAAYQNSYLVPILVERSEDQGGNAALNRNSISFLTTDNLANLAGGLKFQGDTYFTAFTGIPDFSVSGNQVTNQQAQTTTPSTCSSQVLESQCSMTTAATQLNKFVMGKSVYNTGSILVGGIVKQNRMFYAVVTTNDNNKGTADHNKQTNAVTGIQWNNLNQFQRQGGKFYGFLTTGEFADDARISQNVLVARYTMFEATTTAACSFDYSENPKDECFQSFDPSQLGLSYTPVFNHKTQTTFEVVLPPSSSKFELTEQFDFTITPSQQFKCPFIYLLRFEGTGFTEGSQIPTDISKQQSMMLYYEQDAAKGAGIKFDMLDAVNTNQFTSLQGRFNIYLQMKDTNALQFGAQRFISFKPDYQFPECYPSCSGSHASQEYCNPVRLTSCIHTTSTGQEQFIKMSVYRIRDSNGVMKNLESTTNNPIDCFDFNASPQKLKSGRADCKFRDLGSYGSNAQFTKDAALPVKGFLIMKSELPKEILTSELISQISPQSQQSLLYISAITIASGDVSYIQITDDKLIVDAAAPMMQSQLFSATIHSKAYVPKATSLSIATVSATDQLRYSYQNQFKLTIIDDTPVVTPQPEPTPEPAPEPVKEVDPEINLIGYNNIISISVKVKEDETQFITRKSYSMQLEDPSTNVEIQVTCSNKEVEKQIKVQRSQDKIDIKFQGKLGHEGTYFAQVVLSNQEYPDKAKQYQMIIIVQDDLPVQEEEEQKPEEDEEEEEQNEEEQENASEEAQTSEESSQSNSTNGPTNLPSESFQQQTQESNNQEEQKVDEQKRYYEESLNIVGETFTPVKSDVNPFVFQNPFMNVKVQKRAPKVANKKTQETKKPVPPKVQDIKIGEDGVLKMSFSRPVTYPPGLETLVSKRMLKSISINDLLVLVPIAQFPSNQEKMSLEGVEPLKITDKQIHVKLDFNDPSTISMASQTERDLMQISFNRALLNEIRDKENDLPLVFKNSYGPQYRFNMESTFGEQKFQKLQPGESLDMVTSATGSFFIEIPPQLDKRSNTIRSLRSASAAVQNASLISMVINFLLAAILGSSLKMLWDALNSLGNVLYLPLLSVNLPGIVQLVFDKLIPMTQFELLPSEDIIEAIFSFESTEEVPKNTRYQSLGFETVNYIHGLGSAFFYMILLILAHIFLFLYKLKYGETERYKKWLLKVSVNGRVIPIIVRFLLQTYIDLLIICKLNLEFTISEWGNEDQNHSLSDKLSIYIGHAFTVIVVVYPLYVFLVLIYRRYMYFKREESEDFIQRNEELWLDLKPYSLWSINYYLFFILRRVAYVGIIFFFQRDPLVQLSLATVLCLAWLSYIVLKKPFKNSFSNKMEAFNESCTAVSMYHMLGFTDANDKVDSKIIVGYSMLGVLAINVVSNLIIILVCSVQDIIKQKLLQQRRDNFQKNRVSLVPAPKIQRRENVCIFPISDLHELTEKAQSPLLKEEEGKSNQEDIDFDDESEQKVSVIDIKQLIKPSRRIIARTFSLKKKEVDLMPPIEAIYDDSMEDHSDVEEVKLQVDIDKERKNRLYERMNFERMRLNKKYQKYGVAMKYSMIKAEVNKIRQQYFDESLYLPPFEGTPFSLEEQEDGYDSEFEFYSSFYMFPEDVTSDLHQRIDAGNNVQELRNIQLDLQQKIVKEMTLKVRK